MASTKSTASTTISSGDFVKIDGKGIALVKQQVCRDGAVMYIVQVCGCDFDVEIDAKRVQTVTADSDSETKQTTGSSSRFKIVTDQEVNDFNTGVGSGGGKGGMCPPTFLTGGAMVCLCPPTFNPIFLFSTWIICLYNTDK